MMMVSTEFHGDNNVCGKSLLCKHVVGALNKSPTSVFASHIYFIHGFQSIHMWTAGNKIINQFPLLHFPLRNISLSYFGFYSFSLSWFLSWLCKWKIHIFLHYLHPLLTTFLGSLLLLCCCFHPRKGESRERMNIDKISFIFMLSDNEVSERKTERKK